MDSPKIKRALVSVSNKLGIVDFVKGLVDHGIEIYSTGGTRKHLATFGIPSVDIAQYTQFPEMMGGRVKTLHPKSLQGSFADETCPTISRRWKRIKSTPSIWS